MELYTTAERHVRRTSHMWVACKYKNGFEIAETNHPSLHGAQGHGNKKKQGTLLFLFS